MENIAKEICIHYAAYMAILIPRNMDINFAIIKIWKKHKSSTSNCPYYYVCGATDFIISLRFLFMLAIQQYPFKPTLGFAKQQQFIANFIS